MHIAENIKIIRQKWGKTQDEMGVLLGATKAMVQSYERKIAEPKRIFLENLSRVSGIPVNDLLKKEISINNIKFMPGEPDSTDIITKEIDAGQALGAMMEDLVLLKATAKVFGLHISAINAKLNKTSSAKESLDLGKTIGEEADRIFAELKRKSG